jgi:poly(A) polymerase/tRNA nucleotidyltransferase (CCA-adding enzyme)
MTTLLLEKNQIPEEIEKISKTLKNKGFSAYLVGGCVRDILIGREPKDWDFTTNASPEQIQELFEETFYENDFGTVGVVLENVSRETLKVIEITPYRKETGYTDNRRPDSVEFGVSLEEDLARRDFTINAIALDPKTGEVIDPYAGIQDINKRILRAVGVAKERFNEDGLRILRAVRLATELHFEIEDVSRETIQKSASILQNIAKERIRDEFTRIILSDKPFYGLSVLRELGLIKYIIPDLEESFGVAQNQAHSYDVWEHIIRTVQASADKKYSLEIRLAALFHDIGKPHTRALDTKKDDWSFHGHEVVGATVSHETLTNLHYPNEVIKKVRKLVRWHMFFSDTEEITLSAVRRLISNVGKENVDDLMKLRVCDRIGTGRPKEQPYRFRKYKSMIAEVSRDPVSVSMLAIDGSDIMDVSHETPSPRLGWILHALLEEVLDDPKKNTPEYLKNRSIELSKLDDAELKKLGEKGKNTQEEAEERELQKIRKKFHVK